MLSANQNELQLNLFLNSMVRINTYTQKTKLVCSSLLIKILIDTVHNRMQCVHTLKRACACAHTPIQCQKRHQHTHTHTRQVWTAFPPPPHIYCLQSSNYNSSTAVNYLLVLFYTSTYNCQNLTKNVIGRHVAEVVCSKKILQHETVIITYPLSNFSQALILLLRGHPGSAEPGPGCRQLAPVPAC